MEMREVRDRPEILETVIDYRGFKPKGNTKVQEKWEQKHSELESELRQKETEQFTHKPKINPESK